MFVWRKRAGARWLAANEAELRELARERLAVIFKPANKTQIAEVAATNRRKLEFLRARFGGAVKRLPHDWQTHEREAKPIKIGQRLIIARSQIVGRALRLPTLVIPAGTAFGTGEHATTAMSLRLLERTMRRLRGAHAPRLLVSAPRRNNLFGKSDRDILWNISPERSVGHRAQHARRMRPFRAKKLLRARSRDRLGNSRARGRSPWSATRHRARLRSARHFHRQRKRAPKQNSQCRVSSCRCAPMEISASDRHRNREPV